MGHNFQIRRSVRDIILFVLAIILLIGCDQFTKHLAIVHLKGAEAVPLIDNIIEFVYVENRGAAFGMMTGMKGLFVVLAFIVSAACIAIYACTPKRQKLLPFDICLCFIVSGALGNVIDRLRYGFVVDFIYFRPIDFPVFNIADILVTSSAALLIILFVFIYKEDDVRDIMFIGEGRNEEH